MTPHHHCSDQDYAFRTAFETCAVAPADFNHAAHVRLAYVDLVDGDGDIESAVARMKAALLGFLNHNGVPLTKYHETLTRSWVLAVRHFMDRSTVPIASADAFVAQHPQLLDSRIMLTHYSTALLFSDQARAAFVQPDLEPIPHAA